MANTNYRCPCCRKISSNHHDLARHFLGQTDKKHKDWLKTQGLSYAQLITWQVTEFGNKGYDTLAEVLEKEAPKVE
jgi:hypothetical protein